MEFYVFGAGAPVPGTVVMGFVPVAALVFGYVVASVPVIVAARSAVDARLRRVRRCAVAPAAARERLGENPA